MVLQTLRLSTLPLGLLFLLYNFFFFCLFFNPRSLRTVPAFTTVHAFCSSPGSLRKSGSLTAVPAKTEIFPRLTREKQILARVIEIRKKKLGVITHFSEIIQNLQIGETKLTHCFVFRFLELLLLKIISKKVHGYPLIFFLDSNSPC